MRAEGGSDHRERACGTLALDLLWGGVRNELLWCAAHCQFLSLLSSFFEVAAVATVATVGRLVPFGSWSVVGCGSDGELAYGSMLVA